MGSLPLSVCRLGSNHGQEFARAFLHIFFSKQYVNVSRYENLYIESLKEDLQNNITNTFGLMEALQEPNFFNEFEKFSNSESNEYWKFPMVYSFIKYRIWSIVVHQQQLEGMFNRYDIKVHPNMSKELQESRIILSSPDNEGINITQENLQKIRQQFREKRKVKNENENTLLREEAANSILNSLLS